MESAVYSFFVAVVATNEHTTYYSMCGLQVMIELEIHRKATKPRQAHYHTPQYLENGSWELRKSGTMCRMPCVSTCQTLCEKVLTGNALKAFMSMKRFFSVSGTLRAAVSQGLDT